MSSTTAVILAAGVGSRLAPLTDSLPKCLVPVVGIPILHHQISALRQAGIGRIIVVAGYRSAQVKAAALSDCQVLENSEYLETNNMFSLSLARPYVASDMILLNGDVMFAADIVRDLAAQDDCIATDVGRYLDESMKVEVRQDGTISHISKSIPPESALGCSIDLYHFSKSTSEHLFETIDKFLKEHGPKQWTEVAIDRLLGQIAIRPFDIAGRAWVEIDNLADLQEAEAKWSQPVS